MLVCKRNHTFVNLFLSGFISMQFKCLLSVPLVYLVGRRRCNRLSEPPRSMPCKCASGACSVCVVAEGVTAYSFASVVMQLRKWENIEVDN